MLDRVCLSDGACSASSLACVSAADVVAVAVGDEDIDIVAAAAAAVAAAVAEDAPELDLNLDLDDSSASAFSSAVPVPVPVPDCIAAAAAGFVGELVGTDSVVAVAAADTAVVVEQEEQPRKAVDLDPTWLCGVLRGLNFVRYSHNSQCYDMI